MMFKANIVIAALADPLRVNAAEAGPKGKGDTLPDGHAIVIDPRFFTPNDNASDVRSSDTLYRIDGLTGQIPDIIGDLLRDVTPALGGCQAQPCRILLDRLLASPK